MVRKFITNFTKTVRLHYQRSTQYTISKLQRTSSSIGFVEQALHHKFTPTFAKVNGNFGHKKEKWKANKSILEHNLREHRTML